MIYTENDISKAIHRIAYEIEENHKYEQEVIFVCILKSGFMFCADLIRLIDLPIRLEFIEANHNQHSNNVYIKSNILDQSLNNENIILIDCLIDSGLTVNEVIKHLELTYGPRQIKVCALIDKIGIADYVALEDPKCPMKGYGLDDNQMERNLPWIESK